MLEILQSTTPQLKKREDLATRKNEVVATQQVWREIISQLYYLFMEDREISIEPASLTSEQRAFFVAFKKELENRRRESQKYLSKMQRQAIFLSMKHLRRFSLGEAILFREIKLLADGPVTLELTPQGFHILVRNEKDWKKIFPTDTVFAVHQSVNGGDVSLIIVSPAFEQSKEPDKEKILEHEQVHELFLASRRSRSKRPKRSLSSLGIEPKTLSQDEVRRVKQIINQLDDLDVKLLDARQEETPGLDEQRVLLSEIRDVTFPSILVRTQEELVAMVSNYFVLDSNRFLLSQIDTNSGVITKRGNSYFHYLSQLGITPDMFSKSYVARSSYNTLSDMLTTEISIAIKPINEMFRLLGYLPLVNAEARVQMQVFMAINPLSSWPEMFKYFWGVRPSQIKTLSDPLKKTFNWLDQMKSALTDDEFDLSPTLASEITSVLQSGDDFQKLFVNVPLDIDIVTTELNTLSSKTEQVFPKVFPKFFRTE